MDRWSPLTTATAALGLALALLAGPALAQVLGGGVPGVGVGGGGLQVPGIGQPRATLPDPAVGPPSQPGERGRGRGRGRVRGATADGGRIAAPQPGEALAGAVPEAAGPLSPVTQSAGALADQAVQGAAAVAGAAEAAVPETRRAWAERLLRDHPDFVEADDLGQPVVRGQILAVAADPAGVERARRAGFGVSTQESYGDLGLTVTVLTPPSGLSAREAVRRLRELDPAGQYEFNHLYQEGGAAAVPAAGVAAAPALAGSAQGVRVGLVDGSSARHPALAGARLVQRAFGPGGSKPTAHATAVASLIAGAHGRFRGAAPGATLYVADVFGPTPAGGSAGAIVRGLSWLAQERVPVINVSLVGPPNRLFAAAVQALVRRGHVVVAAVGNDGPAAPPLYPAAWPGVLAVTGVDARRRVLPEAGRGAHVDFAAPGADLAAGGLDGRYITVRGTSFAAPIAAGRLARHLAAPDPAAAQRAIAALGREAADLGVRGADPVYGRGLVGFEVRTDPAAVGAARLASRSR